MYNLVRKLTDKWKNICILTKYLKTLTDELNKYAG